MSETLQRKSLNLPNQVGEMVKQVQEDKGLNFTDALVSLVERGYFLHVAIRDKQDVQVDGKSVILL